MPTQNQKSRIVSVRLPLDVYETLQKRHGNVSGYLRERITYDTKRAHTQRAAKKQN